MKDEPMKLDLDKETQNKEYKKPDPFGNDDDSSCSNQSWGAEMGNEDYEELPPDTILRRREMRLKTSQLMICTNGVIAAKQESEKKVPVQVTVDIGDDGVLFWIEDEDLPARFWGY